MKENHSDLTFVDETLFIEKNVELLKKVAGYVFSKRKKIIVGFAALTAQI